MNHRMLRRAIYVTSALLVVSAGVGTAYFLVQRLEESGTEATGVSASGKLVYSPEFTLEDAQEFDLFSLYWLGENFQGNPVARLFAKNYSRVGLEEEFAKNIVGFDYGTCAIEAGAEACAVPLTIQIRPYCQVPPEIVAERVKTGPPVQIREATAQWTGPGMILWTKDVSISITGDNAELVNAAAHNLIALTPGGPMTPDDPLGTPDSITCPHKPHYLP
jgi:hypothetical protein